MTEAVPWARPRARHSRDFEDVVAWLAQRAEGKNAATLGAFHDRHGESGCAAVEAVSTDLGTAFKKATDTHAPGPANA